MDIGSAALGRALDQRVDELDHRCLAGELLELLDVVEVARDVAILSGGAVLAQPLVQALERRLDIRRYADARDNVATADERQRLDDVVIEGVRHRNDEFVAVRAKNESLVFPQETLRYIAVVLDFIREIGFIDERHLELAGQPMCNISVGY